MRITYASRGACWIAAGIGSCVAVAAVVIAAPAAASTTVPAQLALTGVVTASSPLGGSVVGVHPGDQVDFTAAPAAVSAQGLNSLGIPIGDVLGSLLGQVTGYQVVMHLPAGFPGGRRDVRLGPCGGRPDLKISFPNAGRYNFTWSAYAVTVLALTGACTLNTLHFDGTELAKAGIALNASTQWVGQVVAASDPPIGGLSVQVPAVGAQPGVTGVGALPSVGVPGTALPTVPVSPPSVTPPLPPTSGSPPAGEGGWGVDYTPHGRSVEEDVVPNGYGGAEPGGAGGMGRPGLNRLGAGVAVRDGSGGASALSGRTWPQQARKPVDLAASRPPAGGLPVVLAIMAIIALSLVTAAYARLHLLRRTMS